MTVLWSATARRYIATGWLLKASRTSAFFGANLDDDEGRYIDTLSAVSQLMTDLARLG